MPGAVAMMENAGGGPDSPANLTGGRMVR